jgi:16S rRNA (cytosine967-C5)-methyltransferase
VSQESPREIAVRVLKRRIGPVKIGSTRAGHEGPFVENLLDEELSRHPLSQADRGLCQELVYGIARWQAALDWLIGRKTGNRVQKPVLQLLLRLGLYQIFWLDRIPPHAAVHETVQLAKELGFGAQAGFLNAILRGYLREQDATVTELARLKTADPATGFSHPSWLVERWTKKWGAARTSELLQWNNAPAPTFARVNSLKTDAARLTAEWKLEGVRFVERHWDWTGADLAFELQSHPPLNSLVSFQQGRFYIQDPSTLLAVAELDPQPGDTVLDLCAAPGGKTTFIAQRMENRGEIIAQDNQSERLRRVEENCVRLGVTCVQTACADACTNPEPDRLFDRILVDAPCSNTGVIRRRVDLRWRIEPPEIERLATLQKAILAQAAKRLKPGGTLVYSTCSLEPEENETVVAAFAGAHPDFQLRSQRQLLPFVDNVDGAFVATFVKQK